ncbi:MAG: BatA domain-containing protein, partial [Planctomycetota bacterium]|nr:BatA domain-containing protein [Planctomycetota bacterium]
MTFFNATLIFGITAIAVPLVLHLVARREPRKVVFPSVRFLTKRFESNRSRLRVRRWWLLALRIAALA